MNAMRYVSHVAGFARGLVGRKARLGAAVAVAVAMPAGLWGQGWQTIGSVVSVPAGTSVGIGTASPATGFHVYGTSYDLARFESSAPYAGLSIKSAGHQYELQSDGFNSFMLYDRTNAASRLYVTSAGSVGIGTASPATGFHVYGTSYDLARFESSAPYAGLSIKSTGHQYELQSDGYNSFMLYDRTNAASRLYVTSAGNVGIGTNNPQNALSVNGTIQGKQVIVNTGWSDYVFAPNYRLQPLPEVASYIKANGHLPGIPAAEEVEAQGVNLGDMQSKLLAKVEELTLHMIAADERNHRLERQSLDLEKQNRELQERIARLEAGQGTH